MLLDGPATRYSTSMKITIDLSQAQGERLRRGGGVGHGATETFLVLNRHEIGAATDAQEHLMLDLAAGRLDHRRLTALRMQSAAPSPCSVVWPLTASNTGSRRRSGSVCTPTERCRHFHSRLRRTLRLSSRRRAGLRQPAVRRSVVRAPAECQMRRRSPGSSSSYRSIPSNPTETRRGFSERHAQLPRDEVRETRPVDPAR